TPGAWSAGDDPLGGPQDGPTESMDTAVGRAPRQKPYGSRGREQECPDCLGAVDKPPGLSAIITGEELVQNHHLKTMPGRLADVAVHRRLVEKKGAKQVVGQFQRSTSPAVIRPQWCLGSFLR